MVSFDRVYALAATLEEPQTRTHAPRQRRDWIRGEVHCLMCGRLVGRLLGEPSGPVVTADSVSFFAYRGAEPGAPVVAYAPGVRLRCAACGGAGVVDDLEQFATYDEPAAGDWEEPARRGPGRRPRLFKTPEPDRVAV